MGIKNIQVKEPTVTVTIGQEADGAGEYTRHHVHRDRQQVCRGRRVTTYVPSEQAFFFLYKGRLTELVNKREAISHE